MTKRWSVLGTAVISVALAACGGGGGGSSSGPGNNPAPPSAPVVIATASDNMFPLNANALAVYSSSDGPDSVVVRVAGTQQVSTGQTGTVVQRRDTSSGAELNRVYLASSSAVSQYAGAGASALVRAFDGTDVIRWPAHAGDSFVQLDMTVDSGQDFDGDGRADRVALRSEVTIIGLEAISTSTTAYFNTLHQRQVLTQTTVPSSGSAPAKVTITTDTWYASNIGIVRSVVTTQGSTTTKTTTEDLVQYRVGAAQSGLVAPQVQSTTPADAARPTTAVSASFNVDMDPASFTAGVFSVTDSNGKPVDGSVRVKGRTVTFMPTQPWASGRYSAHIGTGAQDLFGTRLAIPKDWGFELDGSAPGVVSTWPAADAVNVDLTVSIGIQLSEAPAAASVNASTVRLTQGGVAVPAVLRVNGTGIVIEPTGGLAAGRRYTVEIDGITDVVGNPLAAAVRFSFDTTPARFAAAERLYPPNGAVAALAVATGDVNGDGVPDLVYTNWSSGTSYPMALFVRTGQGNGRFNDAVRVDIGPLTGDTTSGYCDLSALAVGDVTGDGRADIVVGARTCGVLVVAQTAAGGLQAGQFINTPMHTLRIADINGDGRMDVVGVHNGLAVAGVWRQTAGGQLVMDQTPSLGPYGGRDVAVGDIDGDGRADLVVSLFNVGEGPNIAVLRQQKDGSFAAPVNLRTGLALGAAGIALGDLNGDGRLDIVATGDGNSPAWIAVFHQAADGSFAAAKKVPTLDNPWAVQVADIDNDGRADIVVTHSGWDRVGLYLQRDGGMLLPEELYAAQTAAVQLQVLAITDLNRDGLRDIVVSGSVLRQVPLPGQGALGTESRNAAARAAP